MRLEDHIVTERLGLAGGRGMLRYPDLHPGRRGVLIPPVAGAAARWDASKYTTVTHSNGLVSQWDDLAGANNFAQATASSRPHFAARPTLESSGAMWFSGLSSMDSSYTCGDVTETGFMVALQWTSGDKNLLSPGGNGGRQLGIASTHPFIAAQNVAYVFQTSSLAVTLNVPFVLAWKLNTTTWECRMNGQTTETGATGSGLSGSGTTVGGGSVGTRWLGWIGEVVIYDTALSSGDMDATMTYLQTKWGI